METDILKCLIKKKTVNIGFFHIGKISDVLMGVQQTNG
jgi:hypothetical protein